MLHLTDVAGLAFVVLTAAALSLGYRSFMRKAKQEQLLRYELAWERFLRGDGGPWTEIFVPRRDIYAIGKSLALLDSWAHGAAVGDHAAPTILVSKRSEKGGFRMWVDGGIIPENSEWVVRAEAPAPPPESVELL